MWNSALLEGTRGNSIHEEAKGGEREERGERKRGGEAKGRERGEDKKKRGKRGEG